MSSISRIEKRAADSGARGLIADPARIRDAAARWMMFSDFGDAAQRHMAIAWSCIVACILADVVWLPNSGLSFASSNWITILQGMAYCAIAAAFIAIASNRLGADQRRPAALLRRGLFMTELFWRALLPISALLTAGSTLSYLIAASKLPLRDDVLAGVDHLLGFDWPTFLAATNSHSFVATLLTTAYQSTGLLSQLVLGWLILQRRGDRLAEFIAVLSLSAVALCIGMWLILAAGAFAYFHPAPHSYEHFAALGDMWTFGRTFAMLRDGSLSAVDMAKVDGIVSFPSFHTMLGVMTIYAARDTRWLVVPVFVVNATMIVATMPVGGHHLADVLAGGGLTIAAILIARRSARPSVSRT
ncbi:phosphatase PAP2 family protein [Bradyrhizobium sp. CER78]|uniref:phosphatase PAP2 family protein n=1 Tax=Bradyrhizobium sp. CER78 TaxID=3039162 RepID=UPI002449A8CD|nr:phosphatase PAP2 family protein [Bradyrhizobium sp. CER78]MDH2383379.1 phosphatase PAP2 family protein [Bradyrhizobium sp. CER78]